MQYITQHASAKRKKKKAENTLKKATKKAARKAAGGSKFGKAIKGAAGFVALAPFLVMMKVILEAKGVKTKGLKLKDISTRFYDMIVLKKTSFEHYAGINETIETGIHNLDGNFTGVDMVENWRNRCNMHPTITEAWTRHTINPKGEGSSAGSAATHAHFITENVIPIAVGVIIKAILEFFRGLKAKKDAGGKLSDVEEKALAIGEDTAAGIKDAAEEEIQFNIGQFMTDYWWAIAGGLVLIFLISKK